MHSFLTPHYIGLGQVKNVFNYLAVVTIAVDVCRSCNSSIRFAVQLDVKKMLRLMFDRQFHDSEQVNVRVPSYFEKLGVLMRVAKRECVSVVLL